MLKCLKRKFFINHNKIFFKEKNNLKKKNKRKQKLNVKLKKSKITKKSLKNVLLNLK